MRSCTILTTEPNDVMAPIHNRRPVILPREAYMTWLGASGQGSRQRLIGPDHILRDYMEWLEQLHR